MKNNPDGLFFHKDICVGASPISLREEEKPPARIWLRLSLTLRNGDEDANNVSVRQNLQSL